MIMRVFLSVFLLFSLTNPCIVDAKLEVKSLVTPLKAAPIIGKECVAEGKCLPADVLGQIISGVAPNPDVASAAVSALLDWLGPEAVAALGNALGANPEVAAATVSALARRLGPEAVAALGSSFGAHFEVSAPTMSALKHWLGPEAVAALASTSGSVVGYALMAYSLYQMLYWVGSGQMYADLERWNAALQDIIQNVAGTIAAAGGISGMVWLGYDRARNTAHRLSSGVYDWFYSSRLTEEMVKDIVDAQLEPLKEELNKKDATIESQDKTIKILTKENRELKRQLKKKAICDETKVVCASEATGNWSVPGQRDIVRMTQF